MILRPPRPTLFPYTTLFRSAEPLLARVLPVRPDHLRHPEVGRTELGVPTQVRYVEVPRATEVVLRTGAADGRELVVDRKSTRLNSSHMSISYAVFCLKKKKI